MPRAVWLICALHFSLLTAYSLLFPVYQAPDEPAHADMILTLREKLSYPKFDESFISERMARSMVLVHFDHDPRPLSEAGAPERRSRPSFRELAPRDASTSNQSLVPSHPPLYYGAAAVALKALNSVFGTDEWPFDRVIWLLRLLNVLLIAPLPVLGYLAASRLGTSEDGALAASIIPLAIPQLTHIGSTVNNDNLLTPLLGALTVALIGVHRGERYILRAAVIGLLGGLALLTKAFALFVPAWIVLSFAVAALTGIRLRRAITGATISILVAAAVGGWWWLGNLLVHSEIQPMVQKVPAAGAGFEPDPLEWSGRFLRLIVPRFWGWFGWFDPHLPQVLALLATAIVVVGVIAAFARPPHGSEGRWRLLILVSPLGALIAEVAYFAYRGYARTGQFPGIQGRYLFAAVVGLAAAAGLGFSSLGRRHTRWVPPLALGFAVLMQALATPIIVRWYWEDSGGVPLLDRLPAVLAWSPLPPVAFLFCVALVAAFTIWLAVELRSRMAR